MLEMLYGLTFSGVVERIVDDGALEVARSCVFFVTAWDDRFGYFALI